MTLEAVPFRAEHEDVWDEMCAASSFATFLHTRKFLNYHGDRFIDCSLVLLNASTVVGVFPAAVDPKHESTIVSHPGSTFGGVVHGGALFGTEMLSAITLIARNYKAMGFEQLLYKVVPHIYMRFPAQDDLYSLFRLEAQKCVSQLSSTIDLQHRRALSTRRNRGLKKSLSAVQISSDFSYLAEYWNVLTQNLDVLHNAKPVHTIEEVTALQRSFPSEISLYSATFENKVEAGVLVFKSALTWHCQYIASSDMGRQLSALDGLYNVVIKTAKDEGVRYFDFGTSNENNGTVLNDGLYRFKTEFGGGGVEYQTLSLDLAKGHFGI